MAENLIETFEDGVATLTMHRPEALNAMGGDMMPAMAEAVPRLARDPKVRCVVLTGSGNAFCAGGDVKGFAKAGPSSSSEGDAPTSIPSFEDSVLGLRQSMEISRLLFEMPKPTLAIIPGAAAGGGLSLALACDLRFALDTAKITTAFSKIGGSGDYGGSYFLTQLVGAAKARELYFTADVISGEEACRLGIVNKVASAATFAAESTEYARYLATLPTLAIGMMKKNLNLSMHGTLEELLDLESRHMIQAFQTEDHKLASQAFVEKRPPVFKGR